jgi:hypothetical protein
MAEKLVINGVHTNKWLTLPGFEPIVVESTPSYEYYDYSLPVPEDEITSFIVKAGSDILGASLDGDSVYVMPKFDGSKPPLVTKVEIIDTTDCDIYNVVEIATAAVLAHRNMQAINENGEKNVN